MTHAISQSITLKEEIQKIKDKKYITFTNEMEKNIGELFSKFSYQIALKANIEIHQFYTNYWNTEHQE
jgi:hypothetical protein